MVCFSVMLCYNEALLCRSKNLRNGRFLPPKRLGSLLSLQNVLPVRREITRIMFSFQIPITTDDLVCWRWGHSPCLQSYSCAGHLQQNILLKIRKSNLYFCFHRGWGYSPYWSSYSPLVNLYSYSCQVASDESPKSSTLRFCCRTIASVPHKKDS